MPQIGQECLSGGCRARVTLKGVIPPCCCASGGMTTGMAVELGRFWWDRCECADSRASFLDTATSIKKLFVRGTRRRRRRNMIRHGLGHEETKCRPVAGFEAKAARRRAALGKEERGRPHPERYFFPRLVSQRWRGAKGGRLKSKKEQQRELVCVSGSAEAGQGQRQQRSGTRVWY